MSMILRREPRPGAYEIIAVKAIVQDLIGEMRDYGRVSRDRVIQLAKRALDYQVISPAKVKELATYRIDAYVRARFMTHLFNTVKLQRIADDHHVLWAEFHGIRVELAFNHDALDGGEWKVFATAEGIEDIGADIPRDYVELTCYYCEYTSGCEFYGDPYNTEGDCLLAK